MSSNVAIKVSNISKSYAIYDSASDRFKQFFLPRLANWFKSTKARTYFTEFQALHEISFEVERGQTIGILGRNGSGKSTLLQIICGTLSPSSGEVEVQGRVAALLELGTGFNPEFTGRENVYLNASVLGMSRKETLKQFDAIEQFADIGKFIDQPVSTYSSGMLVRLAFAVIAHVEADILIIDEALAVGDAFFTQKCMRFLRDFIQTGTVLFVSHDTSAILNLCNKALLLENGKVKMIGKPNEVSKVYLQSLYENTQPIDGTAATSLKPLPMPEDNEGKDQREELINRSTLRNDIEVFRFDPASANSFGAGGARITKILIMDSNDQPLNWLVGGTNVTLNIECEVHVKFDSAIVGFHVKDRLGQIVFGDNTYLTTRNKALRASPGSSLNATFQFKFPVLPSGDYTFDVAIADGSQDHHVQHQWMHDALLLHVHASSICFGVVGIPMTKVELLVQ